ncbi:MAG: tetratricopeptide repeat protein [Actinomycetota bacterium]
MKRVARIGGAAVLAVALLVGGGIGPFRSSDDGAKAQTPAAATASTLLAPAITGSLDQIIENLQSRLRVLPTDWQAFASLGLAYVQQARVTADPSYYPKAQGVLRRSLSLERQDNFAAMVGMAALAGARHDFAGALRWGERAKAIDPYNGNVYGVIGDAQVELGRYRDAFATFQQMVDTRPDVASYARVSYARELMGDVPGAIRAMKAARDIAGTPADSAWASYQLGELSFNRGNLEQARVAYARGIRTDPDYVPTFAGLAKVAWARGHLQEAIAGYTEVVSRYPAPEYVIALGDLYAAAGRADQAERQYSLVHAEEQLFRSNGVNIDLELALFDAAHGDPAGALAAARDEWAKRQSVHVADAYAWALFAGGRYAEASVYARKAMALGYRNALFAFHAGMIQLRLGNEAAARRLLAEAVGINPHFSIQYSPVARATLAKLGGAA